MALQTLDVCRKEHGKIWHRKPLPSTEDGLMVTISNTVSSALSIQGRNVRFLHAAFDVSGERFIAGDYQGGIYLFDITRNRFSLIVKTGSPCTALAFTLRRRTEFLVAMSDYSLKCFDTETKELVAWMKGHQSAIQSISVHSSGRYALTSSNDTAQLWDLDTFQRKRKLNIKENVGIVKVFFLPLSNTIMTCFKDDSIFAWESDTLNCKYQLPAAPPGDKPRYKAIACSRDGRMLVAGGRSRFLHLWALDTKRLLRIIELPPKVTSVKQCEFLCDNFDAGANQVIGVLCQDGIMRFINITTCKLVFDTGSLESRINNAVISSNGHHIVACMELGNVNIYSVQALTSEVNKPPPPLVKIMSESQAMSDQKGRGKSKALSRITKKGTLAGEGKENRSQDGKSTTSKIPEGMDVDKLFKILRGYGEYPTKYRSFIWRSLLRLPENHSAFAALTDKGTHGAYANIHEKYPIKSRKLLRVLQRVVSALAHWSPIFGETDFLPLITFPFVKLFQNNQLICFEVVATILVNWCQHWFEFFPNPPINILSVVENILAHHDKELLQHLLQHKVTSQVYAWPLLETLFSEVLTKDEWLKLWDNVFSNHPAFLLIVVVAYCICARGPLLHCTDIDDFKFFFHHRNALDIDVILKESYHLLETTPPSLNPEKLLQDFTPLTMGQYPVFNKYPKFIVDYQVQERERLRQDEIEYLRQRQTAVELEKETQQRMHEEQAWYRQQELLLAAEEKRRKQITEEEQKLIDQRTRLKALNRELKLKELQLLDATRRKALQFQQKQREAELRRLDDELHRKSSMREMETQAAIHEAEVKNIELQLQKKMFEQELQKEFDASSHQQRSEFNARRSQHEVEDRKQNRVSQTEREQELEIRRNMQQNLARAEQVDLEAKMRNEMEYRQQLDNLDRETRNVKLAQLNEGNRSLEQKVHLTMRDVEAKRKEDALQNLEELDTQRHLAGVSDHRRHQLLHDESQLAREHVQNLQRELNKSFDQLREIKDAAYKLKDGFPSGPPKATADLSSRQFLNDSTPEGSVALSLDRGRKTFEEEEQELMQEVRRLREKLARENRGKQPPPTISYD